MKIYEITDPRFRRYGAVVPGYDLGELLDVMREKPIPGPVEYVASDPVLEALPVFRQFSVGYYGGMSVELGYCMGHNQRLNALEYHRGTEVNISVTDYIVFLGSVQDLEKDFSYDTAKAEAFYIPAGTAVAFYETTLHYCACHVQEQGYSHATFLPRGTNCPLEEGFVPETEEDRLLAAKNKWLLVHKDGGTFGSLPIKLKGENLMVEQQDWEMREIWKEK